MKGPALWITLAPLALATLALAGAAAAQTPGADPESKEPFGSPMDDPPLMTHLIVDQLEGRIGADDASLRWDAEAWTGSDDGRLWLKTEGERMGGGKLEDGQTEAYVSKPIFPFWDIQVGGRYDLDSRPGRGWGAIGVQGLAPGYFDVEATAYFGAKGAAAKVKASTDVLLTNRLILQPEAELNAYSQDDPARNVGSGVSDLDAGLRLRYEITRKFAPYVGVVWEERFGRTADFERRSGKSTDAARFAAGVRTWF
jgi:copper resistance protein B